MKKIIFLSVFLIIQIALIAQNVSVEGYVFEENNRGYLNAVKIMVLQKDSKMLVTETSTNLEGFFTVDLPINQDFIIRASKDVFKMKETDLSTKGKTAADKMYSKIQMERQPGYLLEMTLAEERTEEEVDAITEATIEVFNNTTGEQELALVNHPFPTFSHTLEQGNHYTLMIRKYGYFTKRMEAYVNIKGCILCFDGVSEIGPGVSDNLTSGFEVGTLLANVDLKKAELNQAFEIENIYYDYNKATIRRDAAKELDNLIVVLKDNPSFIVELGSHTDSRGSDAYNLSLSQERAVAAVDYIIEKGGIEQDRIVAKGYGETELSNKCANGVKCSDKQHQKNRRTELKIVGFTKHNPYDGLTLADILEREKSYEEILSEIENQQVQVFSADDLPPEIKADLERQERERAEREAKRNGQTSVVTSSPTSTSTSTTTTTSVSTPPTPSAKVDLNTSKKTELSATDLLEGIEVAKNDAKTTTPQSTSDQSNWSWSKPQTATQETRTEPTREYNTTQGAVEITPSDPFGSVEVTNKTTRPKTETTQAAPNSDVNLNALGGVEVEVNSISSQVGTIPQGYNGYKVEFFVSVEPLPVNHYIFTQHGSIIMEPLQNGGIAYVLGDFSSQYAADKFLNNVILPRYPDAKVIHYKNGERMPPVGGK